MEKVLQGDILLEIRKLWEVDKRRVRDEKFYRLLVEAGDFAKRGFIGLADAYVMKAKKLVLGGE